MLERLPSKAHYPWPMTFGERRLASRQSCSAMALVPRGLMALLFTFYVNYLPFHLLNERHCDENLSPHAFAGHFNNHDGHDGHDGHHKPHPSSEHSFEALLKTGSVTLWVAFLPGANVLVLDTPESRAPFEFVERIWPPGVSPPEPSQPRAPPIA